MNTAVCKSMAAVKGEDRANIFARHASPANAAHTKSARQVTDDTRRLSPGPMTRIGNKPSFSRYRRVQAILPSRQGTQMSTWAAAGLWITNVADVSCPPQFTGETIRGQAI